ncbi:IS66 family transposase [Desulfatiglans anilini]|uniref:IS66 family transposase n=1 Tax=Desulfatiglans anilini TaxID=90728 RepID=UPI000A023C8F
MIGQAAGQAPVNHIDETSHRLNVLLQWLWVMAGPAVAFFMIHSNRSKEAFEAFIKDWAGTPVSARPRSRSP